MSSLNVKRAAESTGQCSAEQVLDVAESFTREGSLHDFIVGGEQL